METSNPNEIVARDMVALHAHRAPQHVLDLALAAIKRGASDTEVERFVELMRLVEAAI